MSGLAKRFTQALVKSRADAREKRPAGVFATPD